jgi:tRNA-specific 2-thiouridylase
MNNGEREAVLTASPAPGDTAASGKIRASGLSLLSGGLDSMLAICVLREQGCRVEAVVFSSPFFNVEPARLAAAALDVPLQIIDFTADIARLVEHPPHGFGRAMNPCIDCHAWMIRRAGERVREQGWDFVATGEVLNQRPMSQNRRSLSLVAEESGCADILVRPLSAQLLEATQPERDGRIDRTRLLALSGRARTAQIELAAKYGLLHYPSPAGGCLLTEKLFCRKLEDLKKHEGLDNPRDLDWLRLGRHFRLPGGAKCIVGRDAGENVRLQQELLPTDLLLRPMATPGPTVVVTGGADEADQALAAAICAGYCDTPGQPVRLRKIAQGLRSDFYAAPVARESAKIWMV